MAFSRVADDGGGAAAPSRLRPTAPIAADAILVGDPGRALLLAQALLAQPKMSNHARGLWGYSGQTPSGHALTVQSTGIGGPSASLVLADLARLGVRRAIRVGTCVPIGPQTQPGELLVVEQAIAAGGSSTSFATAVGDSVLPDQGLFERLRDELGRTARAAKIASFDAMPPDRGRLPAQAVAADMQTVALLARAGPLGVAAAAVLIVEEDGAGDRLAQEELEKLAVKAGNAAASILSG